MHKHNAHLFAFWYPTLSSELNNNTTVLQIKDTALITRINTVLRLKRGEEFVLFDKKLHVKASISELNKKYIAVRCNTPSKNETYAPSITALLPLLKKDDLGTAVTQLVACGISAIQLVITKGVQRTWGGTHEYERLERLIIAAAEQSKHFALPELREPIPLGKALSIYKNIIACDVDGKPFEQLFVDLPHTSTECSVLVGPESDFTLDEKAQLQTHKVRSYTLTPTVLRSYLAITIIAGTIRSWYYRGE